MSQFPNIGQPGSAPNPFAASPAAFPPPPRPRVWLWVLLGIGGTGIVVCCGCAGVGWFAFNKGTEMIASKLKDKLAQDAVAQDRLGTINSVSLDLMETANTAKDHPGRQVLLFHVKGSKGSGDVIGDSPKPGEEVISNATLVMPGGEEVKLGF
jgi:hypothetical protein